MKEAKMTFKQAVARANLSPEQVTEIQRAASATFDELAYDIFSARSEFGETGDMPRSHVIEVTLDADYMMRHVKDGALYKQFKQLPYAGQIAIVKPAFPFAKYGL